MNLSELLSKILVSDKVSIIRIAYVAYCNVLLFYRFDGRKVLDEENELKLFHSSELGNSINMSDSNQECDNIINLLGPVLEPILSYLPDKYIGVVPSICITFYDEIGTSSQVFCKYISLKH